MIIAFPEAIEGLPSQIKFPKNCRLISSTAPLRPLLQNRVLETGLSLYKIYGSTETAGIAYTKNKSTVYELLPFWSPAKMGLKNNLTLKEQEFLDNITWQSKRQFTLEALKRDSANSRA